MWNADNLKLLKNHTVIINNYAKYLFMNRKPSQALKWFNKSYKCSENYSLKMGEDKDPEMLKMMDEMLRTIKFLRDARITPAK